MAIPFKVSECAICQLSNKKILAKKCIEAPNYCYQKAQQQKCINNRKEVAKKRIKKVSDKQLKNLAQYRIVRDSFLKENPVCQYPNCKNENVELHHSKGRCGNLLTDKSNFKALCREHHIFVELHPLRAKKLGLSTNRL